MTALTLRTVAPPYLSESATPQLTTLTFTAVATGSTHTAPVPTRGVLLLVENTNATTARTITVSSSADPFGRTADITTFSVPAGTIVARSFLPAGWESSAGSGVINFTVSGDGLELCAIAL
jgi:hypothetical protein